ncbi:putative proteinC DOMAIN-CONTAINING PROTEIN 82-RELATED [Salix purpurea]|uniref:NAC domain-containing protein n=1 Tax=Salix purpurea TaxID=77065 RepID=A0A9Q0WPF5_SALPP|nr:putative proteinC DOMAIN-CONTAINING PROTEIN 82-RELATED [Salix purpurea]
MLTPIQLLPGYRFNPYDEELVRFYLYPKLTNPCFATSAPVRDCSLYAYQPLQIWNTFHRIHGEDVLFFTDLRKMSPKSNNNVSRKIAGGPATWRREDKDRHIRVQIDKNYSVTALRKGFSYRNTQPHQPGCKWTMYEYSLPSLSEVTVLCQLRRKDNDKTHQSTQKNKTRKRAGAHGVDDAQNTESLTSEVVDHHPESEVSEDYSDWIQSFPPAAQQAHPTCSLIHENRIQMIPNTFFMDCFIDFILSSLFNHEIRGCSHVSMRVL